MDEARPGGGLGGPLEVGQRRTTNGDLPPSSATQGISRSPARAATFRPVATEPVNMTPSTRSTSAAPVSPRPVTIRKASAGFPALRQSSASRREVSGVTSDGFRTTVFPASKRRHGVRGVVEDREVPRPDDADDAERPPHETRLLRQEEERMPGLFAEDLSRSARW